MTAPTQEPVRHRTTTDGRSLGSGVVEYPVGPAVAGSPLALGLVQMAAGASVDLCDDEVDEVLFVVEGRVRVEVDGDSHDLDGDCALRLVAGEAATVTAGDDGAAVLRAYAGPTADVHAPLGATERVVRVASQEMEGATSNREFQVLFGPANGFCRGTLFLGVVPPGAAPWHFHQYEELLWMHRGSTRFHQAGGSQPMEPGCAVRIPARAAHINENPGDDDVLVIGLITPASSPSAAYLCESPAT